MKPATLMVATVDGRWSGGTSHRQSGIHAVELAVGRNLRGRGRHSANNISIHRAPSGFEHRQRDKQAPNLYVYEDSHVVKDPDNYRQPSGGGIGSLYCAAVCALGY